MHYSINLENGLLYTINPKYFNYFNEEETTSEVDEVRLKEILTNIKEKIIIFLLKRKVIKRLIDLMLINVPEVLSYLMVQII